MILSNWQFNSWNLLSSKFTHNIPTTFWFSLISILEERTFFPFFKSTVLFTIFSSLWEDLFFKILRVSLEIVSSRTLSLTSPLAMAIIFTSSPLTSCKTTSKEGPKLFPKKLTNNLY